MLRSRLALRMTPFLAGMAVLLLCLAITSSVRKGAGRSTEFNGSVPKLHIGWQSQVGPLQHVAFSRGGRFFCTVSPDSTISLHSSSAGKRWSRKLPGVTRAVVTDDGNYVMAYSARDLINREITFLDSAGRERWHITTAGAVWSADARAVPGGARFVAGTGERYVYVVELGRRRKKFRRWRADGAVVSAVIDPDGREVTYGTWQDSTVERATLRGRSVWCIDGPSASLQYVEAMHSSDRVFVRSIPNNSSSVGEYVLLGIDGEVISRGDTDPSEILRVIAAPGGGYVCLGVRKLISHKGKSLREKHAVLLDSAGRTLCDRGSLFFQAEPLMVTPSGVVLLTDGKRGLFTMTPSGKLEMAMKSSERVAGFYPSQEGDRALIHCASGKLCLLALIR